MSCLSTRSLCLPKLILAFIGMVLAGMALAQEQNVRGVHEVMDPNSQTDDLGITVPIAISHPARRYPATDNFPTGPAVGEQLPNIRLANQHGEMIDLHGRQGDGNAVVVFYRSATW